MTAKRLLISTLSITAEACPQTSISSDSKGDISGLIQADWHALMGWQVQMLLAYAIILCCRLILFPSRYKINFLPRQEEP